MTTLNRNVNTLTAMADELGAVNADIAELQAKARELKDALIASGYDRIEGSLFAANVVVAERTTVNWKGIATKLGASRQIITANSKTSETVSVRVVGKRAAEVAA